MTHSYADVPHFRETSHLLCRHVFYDGIVGELIRVLCFLQPAYINIMASMEYCSTYIAAAAAAAPLCCCHLLSRGDLARGANNLDLGASTDEEAHLRHIQGCGVGLYRFAAALEERCIKRDALISPAKKRKGANGMQQTCWSIS